MPKRQKLDDQTARKLFLEQTAAYYDELNATIQNAPVGKGFDHAETFAVGSGASDWEWTGGGGVQELDWEEIKADMGEVVGTQTQSNGDDLYHTLL